MKQSIIKFFNLYLLQQNFNISIPSKVRILIYSNIYFIISLKLI